VTIWLEDVEAEVFSNVPTRNRTDPRQYLDECELVDGERVKPEKLKAVQPNPRDPDGLRFAPALTRLIPG
jgi:hypothetical protein